MRFYKFVVPFAMAAFLYFGTLLPAQSEILEPGAQGQSENLMSIILVTTEPVDSLMDRWNTARETSPNFETSSIVHVGDTVNFVGLYAGAGRALDGSSLLTCDVSVSVNGQDPQVIVLDPCVKNKPEGPLTDLYMTKGFSIVAEQEFAGKTITIETTMTDTSSGATVPLAIEFQVIPDAEGGP